MAFHRYTQRQIFFDGNSLFNIDGAFLGNTYYCPKKIYDTLTAAGKRLVYNAVAVSGKTTTALIADFPTKIAPYANPNDIYVVWEVLNDSGTHTAAEIYANMQTLCGLARACGMVVVCLSAIATGDATQNTKLQAFNVSMRADSSFCDYPVDVGALPEFDNISDTSTGNYLSDHKHLPNSSLDIIANSVSTTLLTFL